MTADKATALLVHVQDLRDSGFKSVSISPTDFIALLAERERLRGALEQVRRMANQFEVYHPKLGGASHCFGQISDAARQALEATDDQ